MSLGIRGCNPIWLLADLTGHLFDDTFYMYVLQNTIPYVPAIVYHDPDVSVAWTSPIQFLANGTLPPDIYFESGVVYRLEFRQNNGIDAPSQSDPLIYLVENYVAGEGGATPVDTVAFTSDNQITNPQFALVNISSPLTITTTNPASIAIGPDWFLDMAGTGTVTITQVPLNNATPNPTNAPYALEINMSGWTPGSVFLRQRFYQNGMLWANKIVANAVTAKINGAPQAISAQLVDSNASLLAQVLPLNTIVGPAFAEYTGHGQLPATSNPNLPPAAYIDYKLALPSNVDILVTSIQLVVEDVPVEPSFQQDSINRQIDYTFHTYKPQLDFKPIPSLLVGWDFPLNPKQFFNTTQTITSGTPAYTWDQTIMDCSSSTVTVTSLSSTGAMIVTTNAAAQSFYLLQYLSGADAIKTTLDNLSVNINAYNLVNTGTTAQVYLFYSTVNGTIPALSGGTIGTVNGAGVFTLTTSPGTWIATPQNIGNTNTALPAFNALLPLSLSGWSGGFNFGKSSTNNNFAIVVVFTSPTSGTQVVINSISCCLGDIPTIPAPQTADEVLRECQYYYEKSYAPSVMAGTASTIKDILTAAQSCTGDNATFGGTTCQMFQQAFGFNYKQTKRAIPVTHLYSFAGTIDNVTANLVFYTSVDGAPHIASADAVFSSFWTNNTPGTQSVSIFPSTAGINNTPLTSNKGTGSILAAAGWLTYHYVADCRLGIVA